MNRNWWISFWSGVLWSGRKGQYVFFVHFCFVSTPNPRVRSTQNGTNYGWLPYCGLSGFGLRWRAVGGSSCEMHNFEKRQHSPRIMSRYTCYALSVEFDGYSMKNAFVLGAVASTRNFCGRRREYLPRSGGKSGGERGRARGRSICCGESGIAAKAASSQNRALR